MLEETIMMIIFGIVWLVIAECLYIFFMRDEKDMDDWVPMKIGSLVLSLMLTLLCLGIYFAFIEYTKYTLITILCVLVLVVYLKSNYDLGKYITNKNKKPKKKRK